MPNLTLICIYSFFIIAIHALSAPKRAYQGNGLAILAMSTAIVLILWNMPAAMLKIALPPLILGALTGIISARRIQMQNLPQMVALLNGFGGLAASLIGIAETTTPTAFPTLLLVIAALGAVTFGGSLAAYLKLAGTRSLTDSKTTRTISLILFIMALISIVYAYTGKAEYIIGFTILFGLFGFFFTLPIGGADMPVVISVLNSLSGWSTVMVGFSLNNILLIVVGSLIGASGTILSYIMTQAMHRSLRQIIFTSKTSTNDTIVSNKHIQQGSAEDAVFLMENAAKVIIVPGFGMAAASAQFELADMAKLLKEKFNVDVKFAIHPVAGRMPGHINIMLAEADVNPNDVFELKDINQEFKTADVAYVIGANDTTNPLAKTKTDSPIYQMPILEVEQAKKILFVKRSLSPGYAGIDNPLFYADNTIMLLGDAKDITKQIVTKLEE